MIGLGTIINAVLILIGGICGKFFGKFVKESSRETFTVTCGISVMFISIAGAMEGLLKISNGKITSINSMFLVVCVVLGVVVGEIINIDGAFERFGEWLKIKSKSENDNNFVEAFLTSSFTVCIGAMAIVGSIKDGIYGDYSILAIKSVLDFIIIMIITSSMGKGAVFSIIPVLVLEGGMTFLAKLIKPIMTDDALFYMSLVGSLLIFCVGVNLVFNRKIKVANFLPALVFAILYAFLPFKF